ncbi:MAG TPA: hypothetical protein VHD91_09660 [Gaiellaceae bacterium]|nr:hypothetical protein [Gaiellaceae bacterium]
MRARQIVEDDVHSFMARLRLCSRHGQSRTVRVARDRFPDVALLFIAVAIALLFRGWTRGQLVGAVEDALWAVAAIVVYVVLIFGIGWIQAWRALREWQTDHAVLGGHAVGLWLRPRGRVTPIAGRCVVTCSDHSRHEGMVNPPTPEGELFAMWNSGFPSTGVHPPHGDHVARWWIKETPSDGWIFVSHDAFTYAPTENSAP